MLVYKAAQVVSSGSFVSKPWEMPDDKDPKKTRSGVSNFVDVTVMGVSGGVATIRLKGRDEKEVTAKVAKLTIGKPAEIPVAKIVSNARGVMSLEG